MKNKRNTQYAILNTKRIAVIFFLILLWLLLPQAKALAATYYLDAVNGNDGSDGSSTAPWKTLAKAQSVVTSGDTVKLRTGNYGAFMEAPITRTDWVTYTADTGHTPVFTKIYVSKSYSPSYNCYLKFDGINVQHPSYTPVDDGYWHKDDANAPGYLAHTRYANYVQFLNGTYTGCNKYISYGFQFTNSSNITIQHCEIKNMTNGIKWDGVPNITIKNCYIHDMCVGSGLSSDSGASGNAESIIIENNHIADQIKDLNDAYYPHEEPPSAVHIGSGIAIRSEKTSIRKNIVHGGFAQGMMFYSPTGNYYDMVIENNLFYDCGPIRIAYLNGSVLVRNNTGIGYIANTGTSVGDVQGRYIGQPLNVEFASGFNGNGVKIYNNICIGYWSWPSPVDPNLLHEEDYNILWKGCLIDGRYVEYGKGSHTKIIVWRTNNPTVWHGWPNYVEDTGCRQDTPEYDYNVDGIQAFFVDPNFWTDMYYPELRGSGRYQTWDYHLASGSPGINFGDPNNQPSDSLGSLGPDGFIRDDGPTRDADHHSAGCYEYGATTFLYGDVNGDGEISAYDAALAAHIAVDLEHPDIKNRAAADVSGNGEVTAYDAALIAQYAVGLIDKFPVEP